MHGKKEFIKSSFISDFAFFSFLGLSWRFNYIDLLSNIGLTSICLEEGLT